MYLPPRLYELLPTAYLAIGIALGALSFRHSSSPWSNLGTVVAGLLVVAGIVLLLRRRSSRADAARYDHRPVDD